MTLMRNASARTRLGTAFIVSLVCAGMLITFTSAGHAQNAQKVAAKVTADIWKDIGASERVDLSGRLQMLSQRIAASTCSLEAGVEPSISKGIMAGSADEMDRIMKALRNGNPLMKVIGVEKDPRVINSINTVDENWTPVRQVIDDLHRSGETQEALATIQEWNVPYFDYASLLVSEISAQYSNPADLLQRDAILVDLAGRQRMRTQMMLKQACETWMGRAAPDELIKTIGVFERTLDALLNGASDVGIAKAPTPALAKALNEVKDDWGQIKPVMASITQGAELSKDGRTMLYLNLNEMLIKSNGIVAGYTKHAKHAY